MTTYLTTEAEFLNDLVQNGQWISEQKINEGFLVLKREQLTMNRRTNIIFGERPQAWDVNHAYAKGDLSQIIGRYWVALQPHTNMQPDFNPLYWEEIPIDIDADQIAYNRYILQDTNPGTTDDTVWTLPQNRNQILNTFKPGNLFTAIDGLDRLKANLNGSIYEYFLISDSDNQDAATTKKYVLAQLSTKASLAGNNTIKFNVAEPTAISHATTKGYVDTEINDIKDSFLGYARVNGNSANVFNVATPVLGTHAANKGYIDAEIANKFAEGHNNVIKKIDKVITQVSINSLNVGVPMMVGQIMIYSGSALMYEGTDFNINNQDNTSIIWLEPRRNGERITVLFLSDNALQTILDPIYVKQTGDSLTGAIKQPVDPIDVQDLTNKKYVDAKRDEAKLYSDNQLTQSNNYAVPPGGIISFSGSTVEVANLAPYWYLCDGSHGTPDLRGRFILGAGTSGGTTYMIDQFGGSSDKALSIDNLAPHTHELLMGEEGPSEHTAPTGYNELTLKPVTPGVSGNSTVVNTAGGGQPFNIMPPYYVLSYIMRAKS
jgi:hypothetical protein